MRPVLMSGLLGVLRKYAGRIGGTPIKRINAVGANLRARINARRASRPIRVIRSPGGDLRASSSLPLLTTRRWRNYMFKI